MSRKKYPEHVKLMAVHGKSQACHDFLEFLHSKGFLLGKWHGKSELLRPAVADVYMLLAEFFGIDTKKLEEEKRRMVEECRGQYCQEAGG